MVARTTKNASVGATSGAVKERSEYTSAAIANLLRAKIQNGLMRPGERLVEADLVTNLGSSRMRVREALRRLEAEGFVEVHEHRAAFVKAFTREDVINFNRAREVLEALAARLVAERPAVAELRAQLIALRTKMRAAVGTNDRVTYRALNAQFHDLILQHCGNSYVVTAVERLRMPIIRLHLSDVLGKMISQQHDDHERIIEAILLGDAEGAEQAMRAHIRNGGLTISTIEDHHFAVS